MKKFILVALAALFVCSAVDAQILRADELEKYAKKSMERNGLMQQPISVPS